MMYRLNLLAVLLIAIAFMDVRAQKPFATYGDCSERVFGFASVKGEARNIPPIYCDATGFSEGLASVKRNGQWGYIDAGNETRIAFSFDYAGRFQYGQAIVQQGKLQGVINKRGEYVIPPVYLDLQLLPIDGKPYYLSRDSTFFAGLIDSAGREMIPHRYTYILSLKGYKHLPFYTVFREIDTTKGSFYDQFAANPYLFSPEEGRHDLYDDRFVKLASKQSTDYGDGFPHETLQRVDAFLKEHNRQSPEEKVKAVNSILSEPPAATEPQPLSLYREYRRREEAAVNRYLDSLGYRLFTENGRTGLKKGNDILIPPRHRQLRFVSGVVLFPREADTPVLEQHYGGTYRDKEKGIYDVFAVVSVAGKLPEEAAMQYSLSGEISLPAAEEANGGKKLVSDINALGFLYLHTTQGEAGLVEKKYSLVNWKGEELLPPDYHKIDVMKHGHVLVTREKEEPEGVEEHVGLFSPTGGEIIPVGVYSTIKPFFTANRALYLATWSDPYPTTREWKERRDANKTYVVLEVTGNSARVVNTFTASTVYVSQLDTKTGMLRYIRKQ